MVTFGKAESYSSGWRGMQTRQDIRVGGVVVGEVVGAENTGGSRFGKQWSLKLKDGRKVQAESYKDAKRKAIELLGPEDFSCCGGNDERERFHCSDCPTHPWSVDPTKCSHYYLAAKNADLKKCEHCGTQLKGVT